jgi:hypothetical protein
MNTPFNTDPSLIFNAVVDIQEIFPIPNFKIEKHWEIFEKGNKWVLKRWQTSNIFVLAENVTYEEFDTEAEAISRMMLEKFEQ